MKPYRPINCEVHDGYELACMRCDILTVTWHEANVEQTETLKFIDLDNSHREEHLIAENRQGEKFRIRLDMISSTLPY